MKKNIKILLFCTTIITESTSLQSAEISKAIKTLRHSTNILFNETFDVNNPQVDVDYEVRRYVERVAPIRRDCSALIDDLRNYRNIRYSKAVRNTNDPNSTEILHQGHLAINMAFFRNSSGDMTTTNPLLVQKGEIDLMTTPLHYAFDCYKKAKTTTERLSADENIRLLIEHGANVNARDYKEERPLHKAHKNTHIVLLIQYGAFRNAEDSKRRTPIFKQLQKQRPFLAQCLLLLGAEMHKPDEFGNTIFHLAADMYPIGLMHYLAYHMLKNNNCIISSPNKKNIRPLDIAVTKGNHNMASLLKNIIMDLFDDAISQQHLKRVKKLWRENSDWISISIPNSVDNRNKNKCVTYLERVCKEDA